MFQTTLTQTFVRSLLLILVLPGPAPSESAIHYLLAPPDGAEDAFWTWPNHDDGAWNTAPNLRAVASAVRDGKAVQAWIRMEVSHTPETLNNFWFRIVHSGPIEIYVNGIKRCDAPNAVSEKADYLVSPRRPESLGRNVYAIHFQHQGNTRPVLEIEAVNPPWTSTDDGGFRPPAVLADAIRDAQICRGPDGTYYLTGTTGDEEFLQPGPRSWLRNPGIQVFQSTDLRSWQSLGWVWTFDRDGTWNKEEGRFGEREPARAMFAPEIHFLKGKFWLVYSVNHTTKSHRFGIGLLQADSPQGPWREMSPEGPLAEGFDPSLFQDDDGSVYLLKQGGWIGRLKDDMSGLAEPMRELKGSDYPHVGYEGAFLFKQNGRYVLSAAEWNVHADRTQSYDCMVATASRLDGPYGPRVSTIRYGGHNAWFQDGQGRWMATAWCYPDHDSDWQRLHILPMRTDADGMFRVSPRPDAPPTTHP